MLLDDIIHDNQGRPALSPVADSSLSIHLTATGPLAPLLLVPDAGLSPACSSPMPLAFPAPPLTVKIPPSLLTQVHRPPRVTKRVGVEAEAATSRRPSGHRGHGTPRRPRPASPATSVTRARPPQPLRRRTLSFRARSAQTQAPFHHHGISSIASSRHRGPSSSTASLGHVLSSSASPAPPLHPLRRSLSTVSEGTWTVAASGWRRRTASRCPPLLSMETT